MSTRRKPGTSKSSDGLPTNGSATSSVNTTSTSSATRSPFLPTRLETLLISIYPLTLIFGSLFSLLSDSTRNAPYNPISQSHPPEFAPSYFARKKNVFNIYFVKIGWFWTTLAFAIFIFTHTSLGPLMRPITPRRIQAVLRYLAVTACWVATTQWFFGPPLIDRGFRITGGVCEILKEDVAVGARSKGEQIFTAAACKLAGGQWKGGHDISGHVFLLILGSALLWSEILPAVTHSEGLRDGRRIMLANGSVKTVAEMQRETAEDSRIGGQEQQVTTIGVKIGIGVAALMWWMLLMTAAFFHTWVEKFTGLLVAFTGLWIVYFLPRGVPALRAVLGMPGV
jgi:hypothetical protein